jgi:DNA-binding MarR family transcriptional regulator
VSTTKSNTQPDKVDSAWRDISESGVGLSYEDFLSFRLGRLNTLVQREVTQKYLDPHGLTHPEWRVLARLARLGSVEMSELTRISLMDKGGISRSIQALLRKGLAERHTHPANAKRRIVAITPSGRRTMKRVLPHALREQATLLRMLTQAERTMLDSVLSRLTSLLLDAPRTTASSPI